MIGPLTCLPTFGAQRLARMLLYMLWVVFSDKTIELRLQNMTQIQMLSHENGSSDVPHVILNIPPSDTVSAGSQLLTNTFGIFSDVC